ncbi:hypothetical protein ACFFP0_25430 [Rhizobium puerariae]|uniref:Wadjet protein JetD C-terminal domain-containing protein n=1 Tax=Rhizobium puerariae TaxID=1585791 RepID=A0ABV6ANJ9_9HYPH
MTLGNIIRITKSFHKASLQELTVLSAQNDPYRLDTKTNHRNGQWLAQHMEAAGLLKPWKRTHNRGVFYALVAAGDVLKPDGIPFVNDDECWSFLEQASKAARWLGYVPWERIFDARNSDPVIRTSEPLSPYSAIAFDVDGYAFDPAELRPRIDLCDFHARQMYKVVIFGEKTSLETVLWPVAEQYGADLYLPSGEISDTFIYRMATNAMNDGRPIVVFTLADADPSGYQMSTSIAHKLRAMKDSIYPSLDFRLIPIGLTVEQVKDLGLPSTPLKETEKRASRWRERFGVEQTEIDALATLRPDVLRSIVTNAIDPWIDRTLDDRVREARDEWLEQAAAEFARQSASTALAAKIAEADTALELFKSSVEDIRGEINSLDMNLPTFHLPEPFIDLPLPLALVHSDMELIDHIAVLRERKSYGGEA